MLAAVPVRLSPDLEVKNSTILLRNAWFSLISFPNGEFFSHTHKKLLLYLWSSTSKTK